MKFNRGMKRIFRCWPAYLLIAPSLLLALIFCCDPIVNGWYHMFYRWDGDAVEEFVGWDNFVRLFRDGTVLRSFATAGIFIAANVVKMALPLLAAVTIHHLRSRRWAGVYRILLVLPMIAPTMVIMLIWKYFYEPNSGLFNTLLRAAGVLAPTDTIQWLSDPSLTIPSLIFMDFPWLGAFGVLIYLAGLSKIDPAIYEAAGLDGAGAFTVFRRIELPLLLPQVRINLMLMMIDTLLSWENIYLFLGVDGGPGQAATVPGLLIFREAFANGLFGYGCAIGFAVFAVTLVLTYLNHRFVRVGK